MGYTSRLVMSYTLLPLFLIGLLFYFSYHAVNGERGLFSRERLLVEKQNLVKERDALIQKRQLIAGRIRDLGAGMVDKDLLSEQVRKIGMIQENEVELRENMTVR